MGWALDGGGVFPIKGGWGVEACSPPGKLVWRMSSEGEIRTCFISARLPSWAGVRQGVAGTNVNGGVVGAPAQSGVLAYSRFVQQQQQPGTAATGSVFRAVFPSVDLSAEVGMMRQALAELRQQLQELREVVEIQLRATASEAAEEEEEEEEIVVDEEVAPGAGASTMEEEDEMVLTMTVVGGPEPAGVEAPPPPPTPESDPATTTTQSGAATEEQEEEERSMRGDN